MDDFVIPGRIGIFSGYWLACLLAGTMRRTGEDRVGDQDDQTTLTTQVEGLARCEVTDTNIARSVDETQR